MGGGGRSQKYGIMEINEKRQLSSHNYDLLRDANFVQGPCGRRRNSLVTLCELIKAVAAIDDMQITHIQAMNNGM